MKQETRNAILDRAESILDRAMAKGEPFSEALSNWAVSQAERHTESDWQDWQADDKRNDNEA